ncbi:patatin-domain-containing protein [Cutaneotrichosporon oleaginosum]|uniref:Lysophospholipase NTE1 n=1 Tax=Cutaneotrichosporon oleaginosum TaxID=879819 RepID=A0A0J0XTT6_9TREE|nr:patatin-domain-containing protein [Cutaneotrichosporon oleaginosum]KLT44470.1 patatin-domain-containing protein [Cutaneotrichosporon oleaginosum]TXT14011.1 hypothetical protein COLE_00204 [Cutaneotrichosporon oleaginosum]
MLALLVALAATLRTAIALDTASQLEPKSRPPPPQVPGGNPLATLASALVAVVLYILQTIQAAVTLVTIDIPTSLVRMLHYSATISLGFPHFAALFIGLSGVIFFFVRYRYLTRYTELKEAALPPPSPPNLTNDLPLLQDPLLANPTRRPTNPLHSYLDDFLSAIRIFGYLEKPVFHELSRHLQTRRLAAGETIEIGGGEFWCVVDGHVQVYAPSGDTPPSPDPFNPSSFNGYSLINEVSTGGTLSSLFSILSLFTEEIKLPWAADDSERDSCSPRLSRANSDVSQLDGKIMGLSVAQGASSPGSETHSRESSEIAESGRQSGDDRGRNRSNSMNMAHEKSKQSISPQAHPARGFDTNGGSQSQPSTTPHSPAIPPDGIRPSFKQQFQRDRHYSGSETPDSRQPPTPFSTVAVEGTVARATVDSTLAVIPIEAFKKLTRKFPKATGSIVQVVLERFSRVTFMTAHKFLGLTKEILRSEATLNSLVSYPLPRYFYTGGGMQALREKFQPESKPTRKFSTTSTSDYFSEQPSPTVRAPSLPSSTPLKSNTPAAKLSRLPSELILETDETSVGEEVISPVSMTSKSSKSKGSGSPRKKAAAGLTITPAQTSADGSPVKPEYFSPLPSSAQRPNTFARQASAMRKEVTPGDLATTHGHDADVGDTYYRPLKTPGLPRMDTWRGRTPVMSTTFGGSRLESDIDDEGDLRDALVSCIAKSIGLFQPANSQMETSQGQSSVAPSMAMSTQGSPMFHPAQRITSNGRPPFGNVLDMMNASTPDNNNVSGLLRESLLKARADEDEASSVSASFRASSLHGAGSDVNQKIMKDMGERIEVLYFKKGSVLVKQGERSSGLYYVIDGFLDISIKTAGDPWAEAPTVSAQMSKRPFGAAMGLREPHSPTGWQKQSKKVEEQLFTIKPGGLAGYLASLCGTESYVNITAKTDCFVGFLPQSALEQIMERRPIVLLTLAKRLLSLLSPLVLHIDAGLDWIQLDAGQILYEKGEQATDFYIVINGRLRSVVKKPESESVDVIQEYGQNDSIGELDVMTGHPRSNTVQAIRETELVRIPAALFDALSMRHPATTVQFMRLIAGEVRKHANEQHAAIHHASNMSHELRADMNLKTVCILGNNRNVPVAQFAAKLKASLEEIGAPASYLDQATVMRHLGRHAFTRMGALKIAGWLSDQEQRHRVVLYVADSTPSSQWTMTCIRQADLVLVLGMGDDPALGEYEKLLMAMKSYARKELILLHDDRTVPPGSTRLWLRLRPWLQAHHHVEMPGVVTTSKPGKVHDPAAVAAFKHLRERVETSIKKYRGLRPLDRPRRPQHMNDFARIARRICGKQVGLCLSGGGARGISHVGMLQALEEYGVPIDAIAGCSIGAMVGGLYSRETDLLQVVGRLKQFAGRMGSLFRILSDVTYPHVAYTTGHEFNRGIYKAFYNTHIEDFWIPFYCNSTNITHSRMEIHRSGYAWRFVRASMTLAGLLPPLSENGMLLVDGGYMDNTPIGPLRASGIRDIIVVDVGSIDDTSPRVYGDSVSGWWLFIQRFNPFYKAVVPSMTEISSRLTYVSSVKQLEDVKNDPHCRYMAMPVQQFETLGGFKQFPEVRQIGHDAARKKLKEWSLEGVLPRGIVDGYKPPQMRRRGTRVRRMSI